MTRLIKKGENEHPDGKPVAVVNETGSSPHTFTRPFVWKFSNRRIFTNTE